MKQAPVGASLEQDLKTSPEWRARLSTWGVYAAATGATLAMASNADASIIYGVANVSASIAPNASFDAASNAFQIAGRKVEIAIGEFAILERLLYIRGAKRRRCPFSSRIKAPRVSSISIQANRSLQRREGLQGMGSPGPFWAAAASAAATVSAGVPATVLAAAPEILVLQSLAILRAVRPGLPDSCCKKPPPSSTSGGFRIKVSDPNSVGYMTEIQALDWAYNDTAFGPIAAGEGAAAPEPGTAALALLASGAAGLLAWRRRRRA